MTLTFDLLLQINKYWFMIAVLFRGICVSQTHFVCLLSCQFILESIGKLHLKFHCTLREDIFKYTKIFAIDLLLTYFSKFSIHMDMGRLKSPHIQVNRQF